MKIALFMENEVARFGLEGMLRSLPEVAGLTSYDSGAETLRAGIDSYDLVVMPATALAGIRRPPGDRDLPVSILLLVGATEADEVPEWAEPFVQALVDWSGVTPRVLGDAIADVRSGRLFVSPSLALRVLRSGARRRAGEAPGALLTPREHQVLLLLAEGMSNKHVARRLEISEHGVKRLVSCVLAKLNCPNRTLAVVRAIERGLLPDPAGHDHREPHGLGPVSSRGE